MIAASAAEHRLLTTRDAAAFFSLVTRPVAAPSDNHHRLRSSHPRHRTDPMCFASRSVGATTTTDLGCVAEHRPGEDLLCVLPIFGKRTPPAASES